MACAMAAAPGRQVGGDPVVGHRCEVGLGGEAAVGGDRARLAPERPVRCIDQRHQGGAELVAARLARPNLPGGLCVDGRACVAGAERCTTVVTETGRPKSRMRFVILHSGDRFQAQGAGFCGREEVLRFQEISQ